MLKYPQKMKKGGHINETIHSNFADIYLDKLRMQQHRRT
jgi:hypothetical protein